MTGGYCANELCWTHLVAGLPLPVALSFHEQRQQRQKPQAWLC